jgi:hypothetical protein
LWRGRRSFAMLCAVVVGDCQIGSSIWRTGKLAMSALVMMVATSILVVSIAMAVCWPVPFAQTEPATATATITASVSANVKPYREFV